MPGLLALIILLPAAIIPAAYAGPSTTYPCHQPASPPVMDGEILTDPAWNACPAATGFSVLGGSYAIAKQTTVRVCWSPEALYVGYVCEEPDVAELKFTTSDGGETWLDDGVEVFILPTTPLGKTSQLVVTARGDRAAGTGNPDFTKVGAASHFGEDFYSLELRIPFQILGATPALGDVWRANFCRNIVARSSGGDHFTTWMPLQRQFNEPENFAGLQFIGAPPAGELGAVNARLNGAYRQHLLGEISAVHAQAAEYAPEISAAARDEAFSRSAREVRRRWRRLDRTVRNADQAETVDMRALALDAENLLSASYDLKYAYLIHKLLRDN